MANGPACVPRRRFLAAGSLAQCGTFVRLKGNRWGDSNVCLYATVVHWYQQPGDIDIGLTSVASCEQTDTL